MPNDQTLTLESLPPRARELTEEALLWLQHYSQPPAELLSYPGDHGHYAQFDMQKQEYHPVRESAWWAVGLLLRNRGDDLARAHRVLEEVLRWQFDEPGAPYHGTFHRAPEEDLPPSQGAVMWRDYDPNWRQFIGTTFLLILKNFSDLLSTALLHRLKASIRLAAEGEPPDRIVPEYSNIAMMQAVLLVEAGELCNKSDWKDQGLYLGRRIFELFSERDSFSEFNSPTYYGIVLYALRLWRKSSRHDDLQKWGEYMESALWRNVASYYHADLKNICGPFDRAYGMDMTRYVAGLGVWLRLELDSEKAPAPRITGAMDHAHDFVSAPLVAVLGIQIPDDVGSAFFAFQTERRIEQVIEVKPFKRSATACLKLDRMWGAESGNPITHWPQYHPATAHWRQSDGTIGWVRLTNEVPVDAVADARGLSVLATAGDSAGRLVWHLLAAAPITDVGQDWHLPGMTMRMKTSILCSSCELAGDGVQHLTYHIPAHQKITFDLEFLEPVVNFEG